jgi:acyl-coenzyme A thioesterase PaaI-like protein
VSTNAQPHCGLTEDKTKFFVLFVLKEKKMKITTHALIHNGLCGTPLEVQQNFSRVELTATPEMQVDASGLIHGGFIFGLADYAAMIAVNHPNVVLGAASVKFLKPVAVADVVLATATVHEEKGKKRVVAVQVLRKDEPVFEGEFVCFVLDRHVLD